MTTNASSVNRVLENFLERVESGRYVPGQRLVAGDVANDLNCSRAPVREALHVLMGEGIVEMMPNSGARICEVTPQDLINGMLLLRAVGALGIELAAERIREGHSVRNIQMKAKSAFKAADRKLPYAWFDGLIELHREINMLSGNTYLNQQVFGRAHLVFFNRALSERLPGQHWERYINNYRQILDALLAGNTRSAVKFFCAHMDWAVELLSKEYLVR